MNLFNCFQAVGFYTLLPFLIQWLFSNNYDVWGYLASVVVLVGFVLLSFAVHEKR